MSKYTTQLRWIIEELTPKYDKFPIQERITIACPLLFDFDYPMYDESQRLSLQKKIVQHYFNKEISFETLGLWKFYLENRLNLEMPYYNERYATTIKEFNYLWDIQTQETYTQTKTEDTIANQKNNTDSIGNQKTKNDTVLESTSNGNNNTDYEHELSQKTDFETDRAVNGTNNQLSSDTPQANYANLDYATNLIEGTKKDTESGVDTTKFNETNVGSTKTKTDDRTNGNTNVTGSMDSTGNIVANTDTTAKLTLEDTFTRMRNGSTGNRSLTQLMTEFRNSLLNIDKEIIEMLNDLFMQIY